MAEYYGVRISDIFDSMKERFRPQEAMDARIVLGYDIEGEPRWKVTVDKGTIDIQNTDELAECDVTIACSGTTFAGINLGKVDTLEARNNGLLSLTGDFELFMLTQKLFVKYSAATEEAEPEQELLVLKKTISVEQRFATGQVMGKFLKALKDKKILAIKCPECGRLQSPPREICAICRVRNEGWVEIGPAGEMRMLEYVYYASPDPLTGETRETPYGAIGVLLDGCKDDEVFWHLLNPEHLDRVEMGIVMGERVKKGTRLRPVWADERNGTIEDIKYFEIDE